MRTVFILFVLLTGHSHIIPMVSSYNTGISVRTCLKKKGHAMACPYRIGIGMGYG